MKWHPIGLRLYVPIDVLENISVELVWNDQRLRKMLLELLRRHLRLNPTWRAIMDALKHLTVGEEAAAEDLRQYLESKAAEGNVAAID